MFVLYKTAISDPLTFFDFINLSTDEATTSASFVHVNDFIFWILSPSTFSVKTFLESCLVLFLIIQLAALTIVFVER